jgi:hypothetical protein
MCRCLHRKFTLLCPDIFPAFTALGEDIRQWMGCNVDTVQIGAVFPGRPLPSYGVRNITIIIIIIIIIVVVVVVVMSISITPSPRLPPARGRLKTVTARYSPGDALPLSRQAPGEERGEGFHLDVSRVDDGDSAVLMW